jgi:K+-sensing histidine kinase KdpD
VLRGHIGALIGIFLVFLFVEFIVAFVISRLYKNRMEYEKKSKRLTRGIAHELKTPLAVTKAYVENWDCIDEEDREEYAEKINREVEDMSNMINVLLEMEKIDDGSIKLNPEEVELSSLIKSVYNRIRPLAKERGLEVTLPEEGEYLIQADLKFIKIALGNYLTNMVKYADKTASVIIEESGKKYRVYFKNDSTNAGRSKTDKLNSNGMGVEINENIMNLHGFKNGADYRRTETVFWFEAEKA